MNPLRDNEETWDTVADQFAEASALPVSGHFGIGDDLDLIPEIKGKTFLEIGCGSGRSIKYLTGQGARKVYGLDISSVQIEEAKKFNKESVEDGRVELIKGRMEDILDIEPVDVVFSVYAVGWTPDPKTVLRNIYSYLKPGGRFIWSWDHSLFADVQYKDGEFVVQHSYHEETPRVLKNWKKEGTTAHIAYRKTATWFKLLKDAGFEIDGYYEPKPVNMDGGSDNPTRYYFIQKAEKVPSTFIFVCVKK